MTKTKRDSLIDGYVKDVNDGNITVEEALDSLLCYIEDKKDKQIDELKQEIKKHLGGGSEKDELGVRRDEKTKQSGLAIMHLLSVYFEQLKLLCKVVDIMSKSKNC